VAAVVTLQALEEGVLHGETGRLVHGLWFDQWARVDGLWADRLHAARRAQPFTVSPLMGLPSGQDGRVPVTAESSAWFRVTSLQPDLSTRLVNDWLPRLPEVLELGRPQRLRWRLAGWTVDHHEHPWAGQVDARQLAQERLLAKSPPHCWQLRFYTPTAFHGQAGHLPFPLPNALLGSWAARWQVYGPIGLPQDMPERAQRGLVISAFALRTLPLRDSWRTVIGCVGNLSLRAVRSKQGEHGVVGLSAGERAVIDLLVAYAFFAGSGHHTTQGMGLTREVGKRTGTWGT
jgi:CRISPR-associated endoribonuclease Cas6